jgi:hypothetical protein
MIKPGDARVGERAPAVVGSVDFTTVYLAHDAFARDLRLLADACLHGRAWTPRTAATWSTFGRQLSSHLRTVDERAPLEACVAVVDEAYTARAITAFYDGVHDLARALNWHASSAEEQAPHARADSWDRCATGLRPWRGSGGAAEYLPWLLDGATGSAQQAVLAAVPAPVRILHNSLWRWGYGRSHLVQGRPR